MARARDIWNWNPNRVDRRAGLRSLATARHATSKSGLASARETITYACKIKETANGCRRCACSEAWQALQIVAQGSFARNVQIDEQSRALQNGQNQAKREADEEKAAVEGVPNLRRRRSAFVLHYGDHFFQWLCADFARSGERMVKDVNQK